MAKLIEVGSMLEDNLNAMKKANELLNKPYSHYHRKWERLFSLSVFFRFLMAAVTIYFLGKSLIFGFTAGKTILFAAAFIAACIKIRQLDNYNHEVNAKPSLNIKRHMHDTSDMPKIEYGIDGENNTLELLMQLDDSYSIVHGYPVIDEYNDTFANDCEIDFLVFGPNGMFIVENKNAVGDIEGNSCDQFLTKYKHTYAETYANDYKNPLKQVFRQIDIFRKFLSRNNVPNTFIHPIVYFCNEDCNVNINNTSAAAILSSEDDLLSYIKNYQGTPLSSYNEDKFVEFTKNYIGALKKKNAAKNEQEMQSLQKYIAAEAFKFS